MRLRKALVLVPLVALLGCGGLWWALRGEPPPTWRLVQIEQRDVRSTVSATGALEAVSTVEVGTQVSGIVAELLVDYNDEVEAGQVIARIDTSLLQADVAAAQASYDAARADRAKAETDLQRLEGLLAKGAAAKGEVDDARTAFQVADARVRQARVGFDRARSNLGYASISAPISGTVVRRDVERGQTVNAGLSAPTLFLIAGDLAQMRILAAVDEADIGRIREGQRVEFTVQAYTDAKFEGEVRQVRLASVTVENVVTYTVVVDVDNADGKLLPGMTATVEFVVEEAPDVLCVPNAALRFRPEPAQMSAAAAAAEGGDRGKAGRDGKGGGRRSASRKLWVVGADGLLSPLPVEVGLSDGSCTQVAGEGIAAGQQFVAGVQRADGGSGSTNPFEQKPAERRRGGF